MDFSTLLLPPNLSHNYPTHTVEEIHILILNLILGTRVSGYVKIVVQKKKSV
jgi:hypothetical protein